MLIATALIAGFALDVIFGDPPLLYHPVRAIGSLITSLEKKLYPPEAPKRRFAGALLCAVVYAATLSVSICAVLLAKKINVWLHLAVEVYVCFRLLALNSLSKESTAVYDALQKNDITNARKRLSYIVGRDTAVLNDKEIITATVETVAENVSDGEIAPLFYFAIGGAPFMALYKAVNTLDSMIGYKNEKYIDFGRFAALTDDVFNFIPAEISGRLMVAASGVCGLDTKRARKVFRRDKHNHTSPNSAKCESAAAGALGIQLGGTHSYFGKEYEKPTIGDDTRPPENEDIKKTNRLALSASVIAAALFALIRCIIVLML